MSKRVSPAERLRAEIDDVFADGEDLSRAIERVAHLGAQLLLQLALGAEVSAYLGRDRYERAAASADLRAAPVRRDQAAAQLTIPLARVFAMDLQMCRAQLSDSEASPAIHCKRQESSAIRRRCPRLTRLRKPMSRSGSRLGGK